MACLDRETATAYLRGDLEPHEAERWAAHLASCDACRRVVEEISALIDDVRQDLMTLDVSSHAASPSFERLFDREHRQQPGMSIGAWWQVKTVRLALASLVVFAVILWSRGTPVSAAEILQRATVAERTVDQQAGEVLFRVVTVEERRGAARTLVSRRRVETWRRTGTAVAARRAYNEAGRLVAAEWIDNAGARTLYANGQSPATSDNTPLPARALLRAEQIWRLELSATTFASLIEGPASAHATETPNAIHITYEAASTDPTASALTASSLTAATLTLAKSDLRAIEQTLQWGSGQESREFRIAEDRMSHVPAETVAATVFNVDANLAPPDLPARPIVALPKRLSDSALMGLEVEALHLLDGAGALLGEQVNVTRTPAGMVRVEATVDSDARKEELERALAPLHRSSGVHVTVETFEAAARRDRRQSSQTPVLREVEIQKDDIPVGPLLRRYFGSRDEVPTDTAVAEQVRTFATHAVDESRLIVQHAWALKSLASRYRPEAQRALDEHARTVWQTLIRQHAAAIADHGSRLRQLLHPAFFPEEAVAIAEPEGPIDDIGLAAERVLALAHTQDDAVRTALVTSATPSATTTFLQTQRFWHALTELVTLAQRAAAE